MKKSLILTKIDALSRDNSESAIKGILVFHITDKGRCGGGGSWGQVNPLEFKKKLPVDVCNKSWGQNKLTLINI